MAFHRIRALEPGEPGQCEVTNEQSGMYLASCWFITEHILDMLLDFTFIPFCFPKLIR